WPTRARSGTRLSFPCGWLGPSWTRPWARTSEMKNMNRFAELGLLLGAAVSAACGGHAPADKPARPVKVEKVASHAAPGGLRYSATIQPYEQVPLSFKVSGYVSEVSRRPGPDGRLRNLQQGDLVRRGTVLARVNPADYQEKVNQAKAQLAE